MSDLTLSLSNDRTTARLTLPRGAGQDLHLSASDVEALIFQLSRVRADMRPARPTHDPTPETPVLTAQNMRWLVGPEPNPLQVHLAIQHPGAGWVALVLDEPRAKQMTQALATLLSNPRPSGH